MSIRVLIPLVTVLVICLFLGVAYFTSRTLAYQRITDTNMSKARDRLNLVQGAVEQYLLRGLDDDLQQLMSNFSSEPDLISLLIATDTGVIIASNRQSDIGHHWVNTDLSIDAQLANEATMRQAATVTLNPAFHSVDGFTRVCGRMSGEFHYPEKCGFVFYRLNLDYHYRLTDKQLREQSAMISIAAIICGFLLLLLLSAWVTRPAVRVGRALTAFTDGDREVRVTGGGGRELARIADLVNQMFERVHLGERQIQEKEQRLRSLFDSVFDAIITIDARGNIDSANPAVEELFGYSADELIGKNVKVLMSEPHQSRHDEYLKRYEETGVAKIIGSGRETEARRKDGTVFPIRLSISEFKVQGQRYFTGLIQDISERKELEEALLRSNDALVKANARLEERAITDGLTGLFNRQHFDRTYDEEIRRACRSDAPLSLLICDVDHFKLYNDHFGHQKGDDCLRAVAQEIRRKFQRGSEFPSRYGGEEFVVILAGIPDEQAIESAEALRQSVWNRNIPHPVSPTADRLSISIGIATYWPQAEDLTAAKAAALFEAADQALYRAKQAGRNRVESGASIRKRRPPKAV